MDKLTVYDSDSEGTITGFRIPETTVFRVAMEIVKEVLQAMDKTITINADDGTQVDYGRAKVLVATSEMLSVEEGYTREYIEDLRSRIDDATNAISDLDSPVVSRRNLSAAEDALNEIDSDLEHIIEMFEETE